MAYAMMGGIIVGTLLTLLFLPALYVAWFRIKAPEPEMMDNDPVRSNGKGAHALTADASHRHEMEKS